MIRNTIEGWGWPARALHWIVAAMVLGLFAHGLWMEDIPDDAAHFQIWLHSAVGISLLAVAALAFVWWLVNAVPAEPTATPAWQRRAARIAHWALYALIFAATITGWALTGTMREPVGDRSVRVHRHAAVGRTRIGRSRALRGAARDCSLRVDRDRCRARGGRALPPLHSGAMACCGGWASAHRTGSKLDQPYSLATLTGRLTGLRRKAGTLSANPEL